jgi:hypothetical protein
MYGHWNHFDTDDDGVEEDQYRTFYGFPSVPNKSCRRETTTKTRVNDQIIFKTNILTYA